MWFVIYLLVGEIFYGVVIDIGMVVLNDVFLEWFMFFDVIKVDGFGVLEVVVVGCLDIYIDVQYEMVLFNVFCIFCVGVNFFDWNVEYKDGSVQLKYMLLFLCFVSGFIGYGWFLICLLENYMFDYEGEVVIVIGKVG